MRKRYLAKCWVLTLFFLKVFYLQAQNQEITVKGSVTSGENGESLPGVNITLKGTSRGTITDVHGRYSIAAPEGSTLFFSMVGFGPVEAVIGSQSNLDVKLTADLKTLDEIVVVGYGEQSRRTLTTSIAKVSGQALSSIPISNVGDGLKGKLAGVRIYTNNNSPGAAPVINIRGGSSINRSNSPLVIVDGFVRNLDDINPNDIESIEVLKDAASTAIYGSRASNGVVLISTKKGSNREKTSVTFEASFARQNTERNYGFLNARDYISYMRPVLANSHLSSFLNASGNSVSAYNDDKSIYTTRYLQSGESIPEGWQSMADPLDPSKTLVFQDNNWKEKVYKPGNFQNYFVGVNGGSETVRYFGSLGYTGDDGVAIGTAWKRISATGNAEIAASKKIKMNLGFNISESKTDEYENQYQVITRGMSSPPTQRFYWDDGTPTRGYNAASPNPIWYDYTRANKNVTNQYSVNGALTWELGKGLNLKVSGSYFNRIPQHDYFEKANEFNGSRRALSTFYFNRNLQSESYLTYKKDFGQFHSVSAVAGYSFLQIDTKNLVAEAMGSSTDNITTLNGSPVKNNASSEITEETLLGYFGRVSYHYADRYLLSATYRVDGSSRFLENNRWGFFPGVSAGWIVSEEQFFKEIRGLSLLKIRTSYGLTGNNSVGLYDAQGQYSATYRYEKNAGVRSTAMPNEALKWETSRQFDLGVDLGFFRNRVSLTADYFNKITRDLIFSKPLPNTSGYSTVLSNIGSVRFFGFDFSLSGDIVSKKDFEWSSTLNVSFVKNNVLKLPDNGRDHNRIGGINMPDGSSYGGIAEGEPLYRFYGYKVSGVLQTPQEAENAYFDELSGGYDEVTRTVQKGRKFAGDYEWVDRNGDAVINSLDQFELGVTVPHTTGGFTNRLRYKNWNLNVHLDWALGHAIYDQIYQYQFMATFEGNWALSDQVSKTWTKPGDDTEFARLAAGNAANSSRNYFRPSDNFTFRGDYLCIREATLAYTFSKAFLPKAGFKEFSLYLSGNNLAYLTEAVGISPETGSATTYAANYFSYPPIRRISVGFKARF